MFLNNVSVLLLSLQKTTLSSSLQFLGNVGSLIGIWSLSRLNAGSLLSVAIVFMVAPIIVLIVATAIVFKGLLAEYKPRIFVLPKIHLIKNLMGIGAKFFFIQITGIILFSSGNLIITQLFGPSEVTPYNIASKLFISVQSVFAIITTPFWSAFTESNAKKDYTWIISSVKKLKIIAAYYSLGIIGLIILSPIIYRIWIGPKIMIPMSVSIQFGINSIINAWLSPFVLYVYGVGRIKLTLYICIMQCIINVPLAIMLSVYGGLNIAGVVMAMNINLLISAVLVPLQYKKLVRFKAYGIWNA